MPAAARHDVDFNESDREQLKGMMLFARQITRAYRRIEFGSALVTQDQLDEMVQDALIQTGNVQKGTSTWNVSLDLWNCLEWAPAGPRPRVRRSTNPMKSAS